jgi:uncharacterized protein (DUF2336 family)
LLELLEDKAMNSKSSASVSLLDELESTLAHGTVARRVETLRRVTDLFLGSTVEYSDDQIQVFDDVYDCLIQSMEESAKVLLAKRLAPVPTAPPRIIHSLAFDDLIEVAAPVLSQSERLDDAALMANARTKSQGHLLAISCRKKLSGAVTDVLVERGNDEVIQSVVGNPGAQFSEQGYKTLVSRAEGHDQITERLGERPSIPRHHYLKLIAKASASVRERLQAANPNASQDVSMAVKEVSKRARSLPSAMSRETTLAHGLVKSLFEDGRLDEHQVMSFARAKKFDETNAAIACLANVSVAMAETLMIEDRSEGVLILAKVAGLSWSTVKAIIDLRDSLSGAEPLDMEASRATYERLRLSTAQQALRFHRMQEATPPASKP